MKGRARTISADEAYRAALERYAAGDLQQAEALSRAVLTAEPGHPAGGLLAALLIENGRVDEGRTLLRALAKAPAHTITIDYPVPQTIYQKLLGSAADREFRYWYRCWLPIPLQRSRHVECSGCQVFLTICL